MAVRNTVLCAQDAAQDKQAGRGIEPGCQASGSGSQGHLGAQL